MSLPLQRRVRPPLLEEEGRKVEARSVVLLIGFVCLSVMSVVAYRTAGDGPSYNLRANVPIVSSKGGMWKAHDLSWREWDGAWVIKVTMAPFRVKLEQATHRELLHGFCGALLTALPEKPAAVAGREDVFRVDLNIVGRRKDENLLLFKDHMPVPVRDGVCQLPDREKFVLFPTYPGFLTGWELKKVNFRTENGATVPEVIFFWTDPGEANEEGFDYLLACRAAMADPFVIRTFAELSRTKPEYSLDVASQIKVSARHRYGIKYFNVSKGGAMVFDLAGGECLRPRESEEA